MENYTMTHCHTFYTNPTYFDSTACYKDYIQKAVKLKMNAIAFTEHGNIYQWIDKKMICKNNKIKYIHGSEFYIAIDLNVQERQDFHICLYAKNFDGVKELNRLSSKSYEGKGQKWYPGIQYYYRPRISFEQLKQTTDNIIVSTACLASLLYKKRNEQICYEYLEWLSLNKHRCFLEIQPHNIPEQKEYNKLLYDWHKQYNIPLIAGTDTHVLEKEDNRLRWVLQNGKKATSEESEEGFSLHMRTYDELIEEFIEQNVLTKEIFTEAIKNTNMLAEMCEDWELDFSHKYPKISNNPEIELWNKIEKHIQLKGIYNYEEPKKTEYLERIKFEYETYKKMGMCDYILLLYNIVCFCKENNIAYTPRGSCNGAQSLWVLEVTDIDSIKFNLHFFRFVNPDRISLGDVDIDMAGDKRPLVKDFLYTYKGINGSAIVTYQKLALRGACRLVAKGLGIDLKTEDLVAKDIEEIKIEHDDETIEIQSVFHNEDKWKELYPEWIKLTYKALGIVETSSTHACGFVATDRNIFEEIGTFENGESPWRISQNDMKAIDSANFVKMDFLVVDNVQIVDDTCRLAGIKPLKNDELDLEDENVWNEMKKSGLGVFQFEKSGYFSLKEALENFPNFVKKNPKVNRFFIMLALNGVIRPSCASFRKEFLLGEPYDNGHPAINDFFAEMNNYCIFQEQIMKFLEKFCHYTGSQSDNVRKGIAKKGGTEKFLPEIKDSFLKHFPNEYGVSFEESEKIIDKFLVIIDNAKNYGFSTNHSTPYTLLGFKGAWLRFYYPLEYLTVQLNINDGKIEKTANIIEFIKNYTTIQIKPARFRYSTNSYMFDKQNNYIYKGINSIKFLNSIVAEEMYKLKNNKYNNFTELLYDLNSQTSLNARQLDILIKLDFFSEFGMSRSLNTLVIYFDLFKKGNAKQIDVKKIEDQDVVNNIVKRFSRLSPSGKTYMNLNTKEILLEIEQYLKTIDGKDYSIKQKIGFQEEFLGYISFMTEKESDKRKLLILKTTPLLSQKTNKPWAYAIDEVSIGSGKTGRLTIWSNKFDAKPLEKYDVVYANKVEKNNKGYWYLTDYTIINSEFN